MTAAALVPAALAMRTGDAPVMRAQPAQPTVPALAELEILSVHVGLEPGRRCGRRTLGAVVRYGNTGGQPSPAFLLAFNGEVKAVGPLGPGDEAFFWWPSYAAGELTAVLLDTADQVLEADETNNAWTGMLPIPTLEPDPTCTPVPGPTLPPATPTSRPDLEVSNMNIQLPPEWACGDAAQLGLTVRFGNHNRGPFTGPFVVDGNDLRLAHEGLLPGMEGQRWFAAHRHPEVNRGAVDTGHQVDEVDEANNELVAPVPIPTLPPCPTATATSDPPRRPDLAVASISQQMRGFNGRCVPEFGPVEFRICVENQGDGFAGAFTVRTDPAGPAWRVDGLAALSSACLAPRVVPGSGDVTVHVDADEEVAEPDEANNARTVPRVTMTPPPICAPSATPTPSPTASPTGPSPTPTASATGPSPTPTASPTGPSPTPTASATGPTDTPTEGTPTATAATPTATAATPTPTQTAPTQTASPPTHSPTATTTAGTIHVYMPAVWFGEASD